MTEPQSIILQRQRYIFNITEYRFLLFHKSYLWNKNSLTFLAAIHTQVPPKIDETQLPESLIILTIVIQEKLLFNNIFALC